MPRLLLLLLACLSLPSLPGCPDGSGPPTTDIVDFRIDFAAAEASPSCSQPIQDAANNFASFSEIYRLHFPEGEDSPRLDVYWRKDSDPESSFNFFAAGTMEGGLDAGSFVYAGGPFVEERDSGFVEFEVEGNAVVTFGDTVSGGRERYSITDSEDGSAFPPGCVYTLEYTGAALAEQDAGGE